MVVPIGARSKEHGHHLPARFRNDRAAGTHLTETGVRRDPTLAAIEKGRLILVDTIAEVVAALQPQCA